MSVVDAKPCFARTRCNFAEKTQTIGSRIFPDVISDVPVLHPRTDLNHERVSSEHRYLGKRDKLNKQYHLFRHIQSRRGRSDGKGSANVLYTL
jgi:hypothetical protein